LLLVVEDQGRLALVKAVLVAVEQVDCLRDMRVSPLAPPIL
jgi:hypothetical protein